MQEHQLKGANDSRIVGGFGITEGVPEDFVKEWLKRNQKHKAVRAGAIFYYDTTEGAEAQAKEKRDLKTGLEPIDPIKAGMLNTDHKAVDGEALRKYEEAKKSNPDRNRQISE